jgi:hypothetical protein
LLAAVAAALQLQQQTVKEALGRRVRLQMQRQCLQEKMLHCRERQTVLQQHQLTMCTSQPIQRPRQLRTQMAKMAAAPAAAAAAVRPLQLTLQACSWCRLLHPW